MNHLSRLPASRRLFSGVLLLLAAANSALAGKPEPAPPSMGTISVGAPIIFSRPWLLNEMMQEKIFLDERLRNPPTVIKKEGYIDERFYSNTITRAGLGLNPNLGQVNDAKADFTAAAARKQQELLAKQTNPVTPSEANVSFPNNQANSSPNTVETPGNSSRANDATAAANAETPSKYAALAPDRLNKAGADISSINELSDTLEWRDFVRARRREFVLDDTHDAPGRSLYQLTMPVSFMPPEGVDAFLDVGFTIEATDLNDAGSFKGWRDTLVREIQMEFEATAARLQKGYQFDGETPFNVHFQNLAGLEIGDKLPPQFGLNEEGWEKLRKAALEPVQRENDEKIKSAEMAAEKAANDKEEVQQRIEQLKNEQVQVQAGLENAAKSWTTTTAGPPGTLGPLDRITFYARQVSNAGTRTGKALGQVIAVDRGITEAVNQLSTAQRIVDVKQEEVIAVARQSASAIQNARQTLLPDPNARKIGSLTSEKVKIQAANKTFAAHQLAELSDDEALKQILRSNPKCYSYVAATYIIQKYRCIADIDLSGLIDFELAATLRAQAEEEENKLLADATAEEIRLRVAAIEQRIRLRAKAAAELIRLQREAAAIPPGASQPPADQAPPAGPPAGKTLPERLEEARKAAEIEQAAAREEAETSLNAARSRVAEALKNAKARAAITAEIKQKEAGRQLRDEILRAFPCRGNGGRKYVTIRFRHKEEADPRLAGLVKYSLTMNVVPVDERTGDWNSVLAGKGVHPNTRIIKVEPSELVQNLGQVASREDFSNVVLALSAQLSGGVGTNLVNDKIIHDQKLMDTILRKPLAVGYTNASLQGDGSGKQMSHDDDGFGWYIGPRFEIRHVEERRGLAETLRFKRPRIVAEPGFSHVADRINVTCTFTAPAHARKFRMKCTGQWIDKKTGQPVVYMQWNRRYCRFEPCPGPEPFRQFHSFAVRPTFEGITAALLGQGGDADLKPVVFPTQKYFEYIAGVPGQSLFIPGKNLWRAPEVFLDGYRARDVKIAPDMSGIVATWTDGIQTAPRHMRDLRVVTTVGEDVLQNAVRFIAEPGRMITDYEQELTEPPDPSTRPSAVTARFGLYTDQFQLVHSNKSLVTMVMEVVNNKAESAAAPGFTSWNVTLMPGTTYPGTFKSEVKEVTPAQPNPLKKIVEFTPPASETTPHTIVFKLAGVTKGGNEVPIVPPGGGDTFSVRVFKATPEAARVALAAPTLDLTSAKGGEVRLAFNLPVNQLDLYLNAWVPGYSSALNSNDFRIFLSNREGKDFTSPAPATVSGGTVGMLVTQKMLTNIMKLTAAEIKAGGTFKIKCKVLLPARISDAPVTPDEPLELGVVIPANP